MKKFKYYLIGDNTENNRKWLTKLGCRFQYPINLSSPYIYVDDGCCCWVDENFISVMNLNSKDNYINCANNDKLFKAISALREGNDYMQWFTDGFHWELCPESKANTFAWHSKYKETPHKATLEELIEYFK